MKRKIVFISLVFIFFISIYFVFKNRNQIVTDNSVQSVSEIKFYDEAAFVEAVNIAKNNSKETSYRISGAVSPHHLLASNIIADLFKKISKQNPEVLVIIGPNHNEKGTSNILTSDNSWKTAYGNVNYDEKIVAGLIRNNLAKVDNDVIKDDQATTTLLPFVKFYMPQTKVVQLLASKKMSFDEAENLSDFLSIHISENTVVIASVDFSHYLTTGQANIKDEETLESIKRFDYGKLFTFNQDNLDSPGALTILLLTMQKLGESIPEVLFHKNSADFNYNLNTNTTSYFSILYH